MHSTSVDVAGVSVVKNESKKESGRDVAQKQKEEGTANKLPTIKFADDSSRRYMHMTRECNDCA